MGRVVLFTTAGCQWCSCARAAVCSWQTVFYEIDLALHPELLAELAEMTGGATHVPQLFVNDLHLDSLDAILAFTARADRPTTLSNALADESPATPVLPEGSRREAGFRIVAEEVSDDEREFLECIALAQRLRAARNDVFVLKDGKTYAKATHLTRWLKETSGSQTTATKMAARLQQLGFVLPSGRSGVTLPHASATGAFNGFCVATAAVPPLEPLALVLQMRVLVSQMHDALAPAAKEQPLLSRALVSRCQHWAALKRLSLQLQLVDVQWLSSKREQISFFVNLYHVLFFMALQELGLPRNHRDRCVFFQDVGLLLGPRIVTLDSIDYIRLLQGLPLTPPRDNAPWAQSVGDARVHFALQSYFDASPPWCIYQLETLERALEEAAHFCVRRLVVWDGERMLVPKVFRWYERVFGKTRDEMLAWVQRYAPAERQGAPFVLEAEERRESVATDMVAAGATSAATDGTVVSASGNVSLTVSAATSGRTAVGPLALGSVSGGGGGGVSRLSFNRIGPALLATAGVAHERRDDTMVSVLLGMGANPTRVDVCLDVGHATVWALKVALWASHPVLGMSPFAFDVLGPVSGRAVSNNETLSGAGLVSASSSTASEVVVRVVPSSAAAGATSSRTLKTPLNRQVSAAHSFAGGRGLTHGVLGEKAHFVIYLCDAQCAQVMPTASLAKTVDVQVEQRGLLSAGVVLAGDCLVVSFRVERLEPFSVAVQIQGRHIMGSPFAAGAVLDLTNPQVAIQEHCSDSRWGRELALACAELRDAFLELGDVTMMDLVLANAADPSVLATLLPLFLPIIRGDPSRFYKSCGRDGIMVMAILGSQKLLASSSLGGGGSGGGVAGVGVGAAMAGVGAGSSSMGGGSGGASVGGANSNSGGGTLGAAAAPALSGGISGVVLNASLAVLRPSDLPDVSLAARVAARGFLAILSALRLPARARQCAELLEDVEFLELCRCVLRALGATPNGANFLLAAMIFEAVSLDARLDAFFLDSGFNAILLALLRCDSAAAQQLMLDSLMRVVRRSDASYRFDSTDRIKSIVNLTAATVPSSIRERAFQVVVVTLRDYNVSKYAAAGLENSLRDALADALIEVELQWQAWSVSSFLDDPVSLSSSADRSIKDAALAGSAASALGPNPLSVSILGASARGGALAAAAAAAVPLAPESTRALLLLECLALVLRWSRVAESCSVAQTLPTVALLRNLLTLTQARSARIATEAWVILIALAVTDTGGRMVESELLPLFLTSAAHELLRQGRTDFASIPFKSLLSSGNAALRLGMVELFVRVLSADPPQRKQITQSLGKEFVQAYVSSITSGQYNPTEFQMDASELIMGDVIGSGASGTVYRAMWRGVAVAVKKVNEDSLSFTLREFLSEMALMAIVRHRHLVFLLGGSVQHGGYFLVSNLFERGSLDALVANAAVELDDALKLRMALQVARAMNYLHSVGVLHRDLKPGNVLVDGNWNVAVCDFGVSRMVNALNMTRAVGTPLYTAPEVLDGTVYNLSADVFSYSVCVWQLLKREEPYKGINFMALVPKIINEHLRPPLTADDPYASLLSSCWQVQPDARPTFRDIIRQLKVIREAQHQRRNAVPAAVATNRLAPVPIAARGPRTSLILKRPMVPEKHAKRAAVLRMSQSELLDDDDDSKGGGDDDDDDDDDDDSDSSTDSGSAPVARMPVVSLRKSSSKISRLRIDHSNRK